MSNTINRKDIVILVTLAILFVCLGLLYCFETPLWVPPDEERHFAYCEYIAQHKRLPALIPDDAGVKITESSHPPLYYMLGALLCRPDGASIHENITVNDNPGFVEIVSCETGANAVDSIARSAYAIRILSLLMSLVTVICTYLLTRKIFQDSSLPALLAAVFVAANPQFLHVSASVSNETLSSMLAALLILLLVEYLRATAITWKHNATIGILLGCCLLTKISTLIYIPITYAVIVYAHRHRPTVMLRSAMIIAATLFAVSGWWYLRNWIIYDDPVFSKALTSVLPFTIRYAPFSPASALQELKTLFVSFFGFFGALQVPLAAGHLLIYATIAGMGAIGLCRFFAARHGTVFQRRVLLLLFVTVCTAAGLLFVLNMRAYVFMGKYFFVVLAPIAILVCAGMQALFPKGLRSMVFGLLIVVMILLNLDIFFRILKPAYMPVRVASMLDQPEFCCRTDELNADMTISQTFVASKDNLCAIRVMFSACKPDASAQVYFTLFDAKSDGVPLVSITLPVRNITDTLYFFIFPPIQDSRNKTFRFCLSSSARHSTGLCLWYTRNDGFENGAMLLNNQPFGGSLFFTAYAFTGSEPLSVWEGIRETAIRQGEYITVRELQLYVEMPQRLKEQTETHIKMNRLKKVYNM